MICRLDFWSLAIVFLFLIQNSGARKHHRTTTAEIINIDSTPGASIDNGSNQAGVSTPTNPIESNPAAGSPTPVPKFPIDPKIQPQILSINPLGSNFPLVAQNQKISRPIPTGENSNPAIVPPPVSISGPNINLESQIATNNRVPQAKVESKLNAQVQVIDSDPKPNQVQPTNPGTFGQQPRPSETLEPVSLIPEQPKVQPVQASGNQNLLNRSLNINNDGRKPTLNFQPRPTDILLPELLAQSRFGADSEKPTDLQTQKSPVLSGQQVEIQPKDERVLNPHEARLSQVIPPIQMNKISHVIPDQPQPFSVESPNPFPGRIPNQVQSITLAPVVPSIFNMPNPQIPSLFQPQALENSQPSNVGLASHGLIKETNINGSVAGFNQQPNFHRSFLSRQPLSVQDIEKVSGSSPPDQQPDPFRKPKSGSSINASSNNPDIQQNQTSTGIAIPELSAQDLTRLGNQPSPQLPLAPSLPNPASPLGVSLGGLNQQQGSKVNVVAVDQVSRNSPTGEEPKLVQPTGASAINTASDKVEIGKPN